MKALKYLTILLFCIKINAEKLPPPPCELLFYSKDNSFLLKVKVTLIDGYGWKYNYSTNHYDYYSSHTITQQDLGTIGFDSPFSPTTSNVLCWGKYKIEFSCYKNGYYTKTRTFYLDLRDENWAENYNPSHDTYFWYDYNNDEVTMTRYEEEIPELPDPPILPKETGKVIIYENDDIKLWEFWGYPNPNIANFKVPVILKNIVENTTYQFGQLSANGKVINSGSTEEFNYESGTVSHYTLETIYNSKRNYSFKWNYDNVTKIGLQNIYNATTSFDPWNIIEEYKVIRNFKTVYPLTIKTNLPENENISAGNILFKNPTTTNQFETKSAAGDGFILNEAFDSLMEDLGLPELQKYSVKALDNFEYGGYKYYWYGGDFNPTTNTDLLITAPTNKTAYYKGSMISNDAGALSNNSQKKIISVNNTEYVVYESMNKIWLERSIDGGISWSLMNNRQPLNTSEAKHPSITYIYDTQNEINDIYIVYQEKATDGKYKIVLDKINKQGLKVFSQVVHESPNSYNHNSTPIIISSRSGMDKKVAVIIRELNYNGSSSGLYRISGNDIGTSVFWSGPPSTMTRFDFAGVNAINPAISGLRVSDGNPIYYLCWEEDNNIKYCKLEHSPSQLYKPSTEVVQVISSGSGLTINNRPSISIYDRLSNEYYEDYYPIISWTGDNKAVVRLKNSSSSWSNFEVFGTNVNNTNICGELNNNTIVVWSENNGFSCKYSKMLNGIFHNEQILNYSGLFPQLPIENLSLEDYVMNESLETFILKTSNLPYEITKTEYQWTIPNNITKYFEIPVGVYTFNNDITIEQTGSLTIAPGSTIKFAPGKKLLVKGSLNAVGSFSQKIIFTSTTTSKWSGIQIGEGSYTDNQSIIDYCDINTATTGVLVYYEKPIIRNSDIHHNTVGIQIGYNNYTYTGDNKYSLIENNRVYNNSSYGIRLDYSGPRLQGNEMNNNYAGLLAYNYSSPNFGWDGEYGMNNIHHNSYGVLAYYTSNAFLGRNSCTIKGGNNKITDNTNYHVYACYNSNIIAQMNWWGTPTPPSSKFYTRTGATIDYTYPLGSVPFSKMAKEGEEELSPEVIAFNKAFSSNGNDSIDINQVMSLYNPEGDWHLKYKLYFAKRLIELGFPVQSREICKEVIENNVDSSLSYLALDYLWEASRVDSISTEEFTSYLAMLPQVIGDGNDLLNSTDVILTGYEMLENPENLGKKFNKPNQTSETKLQILNHQFNYYFSRGEIEKSREVVNEMDKLDSKSILSLLAHLSLGDEVDMSLFDKPLEENIIPTQYELLGNYPNPFNPTTRIKYGLPYISDVRIKIFNILGEEVMSYEIIGQQSGMHEVLWNSTNRNGGSVSSGVYIYTFEAKSNAANESCKEVRKMLLLK